MGASERELKQRLVEYILKNGDDLEFTKLFWRECEFLPPDVIQFQRFVRAQQMKAQGHKQVEVAQQVGVSGPCISNWSRLDAMPKLCHYLKALLMLGTPAVDSVWLTLEQTHGHGVPIGQLIQVPKMIHSWRDVAFVLQEVGVEEAPSGLKRDYLFGFLVGMIIGDAHKPKQGHSHRHIALVMSKKYDSNRRIGDFTSFCARQFGLRMERFQDIPKPNDKPYGFYQWRSQSSPFIDWMFNVVLGLKDGQHTTYDEIQMDWAIDSPKDFRIGLVQGIAESDGSVSIASQTVEFWVIPDWDFMIRLLASLDLRAFRNREAVSLVKSQAIKSFNVPVFSEQLQTVRYQRLQVLATTPRLERKQRLPQYLREEITRLTTEGLSVPETIEEVARKHHLLVSFEAAQRWSRRAVSNGLGRAQHDSNHKKY